jgi:hypothetical protein
MSADPIRQLLEAVEPPGASAARLRTIRLARAQMAQFPSPQPSKFTWRRLALALGCLAIAASLVAFTGPGRVATEWVSDLVSGSNEFQPGQYGYYVHNSELVGYGELPNGGPYQLRAVANHGEACIQMIWKSSGVWNDSLGDGICEDSGGSLQWSSGVHAQVGSLPTDHLPGASGTVVLGVAPPHASEVRIRVPASPGVEASDEAAQTFPLHSGKITETSGESAAIPPVVAFVGYLTHGAGDRTTAPPAEAVAIDSGGSRIAATSLAWVRFTLPDTNQPAIMPCEHNSQICDVIVADEDHRGPG